MNFSGTWIKLNLLYFFYYKIHDFLIEARETKTFAPFWGKYVAFIVFNFIEIQRKTLFLASIHPKRSRLCFIKTLRRAQRQKGNNTHRFQAVCKKTCTLVQKLSQTGSLRRVGSLWLHEAQFAQLTCKSVSLITLRNSCRVRSVVRFRLQTLNALRALAA